MQIKTSVPKSTLVLRTYNHPSKVHILLDIDLQEASLNSLKIVWKKLSKISNNAHVHLSIKTNRAIFSVFALRDLAKW